MVSSLHRLGLQLGQRSDEGTFHFQRHTGAHAYLVSHFDLVSHNYDLVSHNYDLICDLFLFYFTGGNGLLYLPECING